MKVLITRDTEQTGSLKSKLVDAGISVVCIPTISIEDPRSWTLFDQSANQIDLYQWLIFTSSNAVRQTAKRLKFHGISIKKDSRIKICAVGDQTAKGIEESGWSVEIVPQQFQAEGLLAEILKKGVKDTRIWFPRAEKARVFLIPELKEAGAKVDLTPVYQNRIPLENRDQLLKTFRTEWIDWITFTSSSTVTNFFEILGTTTTFGLPKVASIGKKTTETLRGFDLEPVFTANPQNLEGLSQGIIDWGRDRNEL